VGRLSSPLARGVAAIGTNTASGAISGGLESTVRGEGASGIVPGAISGAAGGTAGQMLKAGAAGVRAASPMVGDFLDAVRAGAYARGPRAKALIPELKAVDNLHGGLGVRRTAENAYQGVVKRDSQMIASQKAAYNEAIAPFLNTRLSRDKAQALLQQKIQSNWDARSNEPIDPVLHKAYLDAVDFLGVPPAAPKPGVVKPPPVPEMVQENLPLPGRAPSGDYVPGYPDLPGPVRDPQRPLPFPERDNWVETTSGRDLGLPVPAPKRPAASPAPVSEEMIQENLPINGLPSPARDPQVQLPYPLGDDWPLTTSGAEIGVPAAVRPPLKRPPAPVIQENLPLPGRAPVDTRDPGYPAVPGPVRDPQRALPFPAEDRWTKTLGGPAAPPPPEINPPPTLGLANKKLKAVRSAGAFGSTQPTDAQTAARARYMALKGAIDESVDDNAMPDLVRQARQEAAINAKAARRRHDILGNTEGDLARGGSSGAAPGEGIDDVASLREALEADPDIRVSREKAGATLLGRIGDKNVPGDSSDKYLRELALDPEIARQIAIVRAKKAREGVRFSLEGLTPESLTGATAAGGFMPIIRQNARFLGARVLHPLLDIGGEAAARAGARGAPILRDPIDAAMGRRKKEKKK
jgi:hypothetical protein